MRLVFNRRGDCLMDIRPIRAASDHAAILRRIKSLMDAAPGTPEGDELGIPLESLVGPG